MIWAIFCPAWAMPAIGSLERFNSMSENTQDEFAHTSSDMPDEEVSSLNERNAQEEKSADAETTSDDEATPQMEQPAATEPVPTPESTLPPEAQGETNG